MAVTVKIGLRERKRMHTRQALAKSALRLFVSRGYEATTVEQIAAAADVAPRTFFRYFAAKEDVLFGEQELEDEIAAAVGSRRRGEAQQDALRRMVRTLQTHPEPDGELRQRIRLILTTPALLAKATQVLAASQKRLGQALAGPRASRVEIRQARMLLGAYVGAYLAALMVRVEDGARLDLAAIADDALGIVT